METLQTLFSGPMFLPTMFLIVASLWGLVASFFSIEFHDSSGADLHGSGGHLPGHADQPLSVDINHIPSHGGHHSTPLPPSDGVHTGVSDALATLLQWLNVRDMPLVFWMAIFSVAWWGVSITLWLAVDQWLFEDVGFVWSTVLVIRNVVLTLPVTKLFTMPLRDWENSSHITAMSLIGKECEISSTEANATFGQVKYKTNGAPLLLSVVTDGVNLARGARVWITHYDQKRRIYHVSSLDPVLKSTSQPDPD